MEIGQIVVTLTGVAFIAITIWFFWAVDRGNELIREAQRIASSIGVKLPALSDAP